MNRYDLRKVQERVRHDSQSQNSLSMRISFWWHYCEQVLGLVLALVCVVTIVVALVIGLLSLVIPTTIVAGLALLALYDYVRYWENKSVFYRQLSPKPAPEHSEPQCNA